MQKEVMILSNEKEVKETIHAEGTDISVISFTDGRDDYICLTDLARHRNHEFPADVVKNWMRLRSTVEYLGLWEKLNNADFKLVEFDQFKTACGSNAFVLSPQKWIKETNAIGMISKSGRYGGGTYAHKDIAFEFASWLSPEFKLYVIRDYQRLKQDENHRLSLDWNVKRILSKANYRIHTDAIKENLIPPELTPKQQGFIYADEAEVLNVAIFNKTSKQWRAENPEKTGNIRDYASIEQLLVLSNLESMNAYLMEQKVDQAERLRRLRSMAADQLTRLTGNKSIDTLKKLHDNLKLPGMDK